MNYDDADGFYDAGDAVIFYNFIMVMMLMISTVYDDDINGFYMRVMILVG